MIESADRLQLQLETPIDTITQAAKIAHQACTLVILNPAQILSDELLANIDMIYPKLN